MLIKLWADSSCLNVQCMNSIITTQDIKLCLSFIELIVVMKATVQCRVSKTMLEHIPAAMQDRDRRTLTPTGSLDCPINLTACLDCGRKLRQKPSDILQIPHLIKVL